MSRAPKIVTTAVLAAAVAAALLAGCATTVTGNGSGSGSRSVSNTPDFPSASADGEPSTTSTSAPPSSSAAPTPVPRPASCPAATCKPVSTKSLGDGYTVVLHGDASYKGGVGVSVLELRYSSVPVFWATQEGETPAELGCSPHPARHCVVVDYTGAHGAVGRLWRIVGNTLDAGDEVTSATPEMHAVDLEGNGSIDVQALQNNYEPDYATGKVYWQTWTSDGESLTSTGCGPAASTAPPPPTAPLTGVCG